jgi:phage shock protein E
MSKYKHMNIDNNTTIVDVRTPGEFAGQHVPGAINIPLDEVAQRKNELKTFPKPIIAYCRSGNRSGMAVAILKQNGIAEAVNGGGIDDMLQATK